MIPNDWERIRTNVRPFLGEAAHWHRWPCEGASDSPRRGRRGPHGGERMRMPKKKMKKKIKINGKFGGSDHLSFP